MNRLKAEQILSPVTGFNFVIHSEVSVATVPHTHDFPEIFLVTSGKSDHWVNGRNQLLKPGALVFIRPEDTHYYLPAKNTGFEFVNLAFSIDFYYRMGGFLGLEEEFETLKQKEFPPKTQLLPDETRKFLREFKDVRNILAYNPKEGVARLRKMLLCLLKDYLVEPSLEDPIKVVPEWLKQLYRLMARPDKFRLGLPEMLRLAACSQEHLCRVWKKHFKQTPTEFINNLRLDYAASGILEGDGDINFQAYQAGFENLSYFYHLFKKRFGVSPGTYRKMKKTQRAVPY
jgi:AraC family cel operon transcriptional repressor